MPRFSEHSRSQLAGCHPALRDVLNEAIKLYDFRVIVGHRGREAQNEAFRSGHSKLKWPQSKHNTEPSEAVDLAPWPINWRDTDRFYYLAGVVMGIAKVRGVRLRWGGDWDMDHDFRDQRFHDLGHFELLA